MHDNNFTERINDNCNFDNDHLLFHYKGFSDKDKMKLQNLKDEKIVNMIDKSGLFIKMRKENKPEAISCFDNC
jgi:hypothetical protein